MMHSYQQLAELFGCDCIVQLAGGAGAEKWLRFSREIAHTCAQLTLVAHLVGLKAGSFRATLSYHPRPRPPVTQN